MANVPNTPFTLSRVSQEGLLELEKQCVTNQNTQWNIRGRLEEQDKLYSRETDNTLEQQRAKTANIYGDSSRYQNLTVPVVKPLVESAVTYQTSVFLTGSPLFGVVSSPEFIDEALQLETIIDNQAQKGAWVSELMNHFRNGFKYNLAGLEVSWDKETVPALITDLSYSTTQAKPSEEIWQGNKIKNIDLYNSFWDFTVPPCQIASRGEYAGYTEIYSRIALKQFIANLPDKIVANVVPALSSGLSSLSTSDTGGTYYLPQINAKALVNNDRIIGTNWASWAGITQAANTGIDYKNYYEVTTLYARILPSDFRMNGVPQQNTPQVWKFIIVNHSVVIYAERQTNAHGLIPILFTQPYEDGLGYQTKSLLDDVSPMQSLSTTLANSWIASRRRAISDRTLYDPSRVAPEHMNSPNPSAKIPVRPSAYGKPVSESVYAFPFRDDQAQMAMAEIQSVQQFAYLVSGQNQAKQGQFVKGNKTKHEFADVMAHANGPDQKTAIGYEASLFTPLKHIIRINILQYQGAEILLSRKKKTQVKVDPMQLRKAVLEFDVSDGLVPSEKLINGEAWTTAMQVVGSNPQVGQSYNFAAMFSYLMKSQGADLTPFEKSPEQLAYEQAMQAWQQIAMEGMKQGIKQENLPKQPVPQQYGYNPQAMNPNSGATNGQAQPQQQPN